MNCFVGLSLLTFEAYRSVPFSFTKFWVLGSLVQVYPSVSNFTSLFLSICLEVWCSHHHTVSPTIALSTFVYQINKAIFAYHRHIDMFTNMSSQLGAIRLAHTCLCSFRSLRNDFRGSEFVFLVQNDLLLTYLNGWSTTKFYPFQPSISLTN